MSKSIKYSKTGVDYDVLDPLKKLAQQMGKQTAKNLSNFDAKEVVESRGEAAYVWEEEDSYKTLVIEGLGTKNLVADEMSKLTGKTYYDVVAQDTVAAIVNDILTVGALPQVVNAYFGTGESDWFADTARSAALVEGWSKACNMAQVTWGGGETPALKGIINPDTIDLAGAGIGIIKPKDRLTLGDQLATGDAIVLLESSGIHANGLSLARSVAQNLPDGYADKLADGKTYGESILTPTHIYVKMIKDLFTAGVNIHYIVNITGHGWRKLMRANKQFTYLITQIPPIPLIFQFIQEKLSSSDADMYATFNMGAGFAIIVPLSDVKKVQEIATKNNLKSWNVGVIEEGERKVIIKPKNITFEGKSLNIR